MKERPILFSAPMVRAILSGQKTQTRRVVKPQPSQELLADYAEIRASRGSNRADCQMLSDCLPCPYGQPGDRLWVRETFVMGFEVEPVTGKLDQYDDNGDQKPMKVWYRATEPEITWQDDDGWEINVPWKPSIHMPRWASRITLEITGVRVERLQDISEEDAKAEGAPLDCPIGSIPAYQKAPYAYCFAQLWESINGAGSWYANPFVWVISFRRL